MNVKEPKFTDQFTFKLSPELKVELEHLFGSENLSGKIREYLTQAIEKDKKKGKFVKKEVRKLSKLQEICAIVGLSGNAGARKLQRFRPEYKKFSELCSRYLEHSSWYSQEAKKAFICYHFELPDPLPTDEDLERVINYLEEVD